jgi:hypothetical protein
MAPIMDLEAQNASAISIHEFRMKSCAAESQPPVWGAKRQGRKPGSNSRVGNAIFEV